MRSYLSPFYIVLVWKIREIIWRILTKNGYIIYPLLSIRDEDERNKLETMDEHGIGMGAVVCYATDGCRRGGWPCRNGYGCGGTGTRLGAGHGFRGKAIGFFAGFADFPESFGHQRRTGPSKSDQSRHNSLLSNEVFLLADTGIEGPAPIALGMHRLQCALGDTISDFQLMATNGNQEKEFTVDSAWTKAALDLRRWGWGQLMRP